MMRRNGVVQVARLTDQMTEVRRELAELKADSDARWNHHEEQHQAAEAARVAGRRWLISIGLAGVGAIGALYPWVYFLAGHH